MSAGTERTVEPIFGGRLDPDVWRSRHARGEVPDALPYGLDRMAAHGWQTARPRAGWQRTRPGQLLRGAARRAGHGYDWGLVLSRSARADATLTWDERAGAPLALRPGRGQPLVTNVIWASEVAQQPGRPPIALKVVGAGLRAAAGVFVHSSGQVPVLEQTFGIAGDRIHPILFGVDADFFLPSPPEEVDHDLVIAVGNDRHRDWPTMLAVFDEVHRQRPATRFLVVSRTVDASLLGARPGVEHVIGIAHAALARAVARASTALVLSVPNLHVSGATAMLEALSCARPAVATANPGSAEYAAAAGDALTRVPPGDVPAAAAALLELLEDPASADDRGRRGRTAVERELSSAAHAERLAMVLDAVTTDRSAP